jgi:hypothetical protein
MRRLLHKIIRPKCEHNGSTGQSCANRENTGGEDNCLLNNNILQYEIVHIGLFRTRGLYTSENVLLAKLPLNGEIVLVTLFQKKCTLRVREDGKTLTVTCEVSTSDIDKKCRAFIAHRANEIMRRKLDMKALRDEIEFKQADFEDNYEDLDHEKIFTRLVELFALKGIHKKELRVLEGFDEATVPFKQTTKCDTVVLVLDKLVQVSFFGKNVMYRMGPLEPEPVQVSEVVECRTTLLSAWQAGSLNSIEANDSCDQPRAAVGLVVSGECVYVTDEEHHLVNVYTRNGLFSRTIGSGFGDGEGQLIRPQARCGRRRSTVCCR